MTRESVQIQEAVEQAVSDCGGAVNNLTHDYNVAMNLDGYVCAYNKAHVECVLPFNGGCFYSRFLPKLIAAKLEVYNIRITDNHGYSSCTFNTNLKG